MATQTKPAQRDAHNDDQDEEDYYLAPQSTRPFGAGLKRKRVEFVPATDTSTSSPLPPPALSTPSSSSSSSSVADKYLSIVLSNQSHPQTSSSSSSSITTTTTTSSSTTTTLCPTCRTPITPSTASTHQSSIPHQLSLQHSHPPSHIDRQRKGLKYLQTYGWDPDGRVGLGATGKEGIRVPVKAVEKRDTAGLGLFSRRAEEAEDEDHAVKRRVSGKDGEGEKERKMLDAKQTRRVEDEKRRKAERLRQVFYGDDLSKYLGPDG